MYYIWFIKVCFFLAFQLVAERSGCDNGGGYNVGKYSPERCASTCHSEGRTMFVLSRMDRCDAADQCDCFCVKNANSDGTCVTRTLNAYDLYKIDTSWTDFLETSSRLVHAPYSQAPDLSTKMQLNAVLQSILLNHQQIRIFFCNIECIAL